MSQRHPFFRQLLKHALPCLLLIVSLSPLRLCAQSTFGSIVGTVKDSSGAVIPGATVMLTNTGTAAERTVMSPTSTATIACSI